MPTIIALDISLSMQRTIPGRSEENSLTYLQLASKGINHLLEILSSQSKLEYVSLFVYAATVEMKVDFTRDYDQIRQAVKKLEGGDKCCVVDMLQAIHGVFATNWGTQNHCQLVVFSNCGAGFGKKSIGHILNNYDKEECKEEFNWISSLKPYNIGFICVGLPTDTHFKENVIIYKDFAEKCHLTNAKFYVPKKCMENDALNNETNERKSPMGRRVMFELVEQFCDENFKPFEATLKCGGYFRLECPIVIWPAPQPIKIKTEEREIAHKLEICGFLALTDVGSPATLSRHFILSKVEREKSVHSRRSSDKNSSTPAKKPKVEIDVNNPNYEYEKLEQDIRDFYGREGRDTDESGEDGEHSKSSSNVSESQKESLCVLLCSALKMENSAALVYLGENWYGFIYSYSDSKKKSNLMLNILPPGNDVIPWLGDLQMLGFAEDLMAGETSCFPVKADKRSYAQSCVVWIRHVSLQSDVQKVLRHAKKMPEKTQHFFKELNRIRRSALSIGFVELLDAMANLFEKESSSLVLSSNAECSLQLKHAANELRKPANRDLKISITPLASTSTAAPAVSTTTTTEAFTYQK